MSMGFLLVKMVILGIKTYQRIYKKDIDDKNDENRMLKYLRHLTTSGYLISICIVNGLMRTPSVTHHCPLKNTTAAGCDILDLEYDGDIVSWWNNLPWVLIGL